MTPSPLVPGDLPSLLLLQTQRERSANLESNSSLCFMLRELCKGFTFCLDGFPEQEGFLLVSIFTCMGTSLASRNLSVKASQHNFLWELNAIVSLLKMNGHHKWIPCW